MTYQMIRTEQDGATLTLTLHNPEKRNALSTAMMDELSAAVRAAGADMGVRVVIITGGPKFFSAGADLNEALAVKSVADGDGFFGRFHRLADALESCGKPVIAAIEGFCITGGFELALACDIRVGAEGSTYAITSSRIGTVAGFGGTQRLPRLVGPGNAMEILFAAEPIDSVHAMRIGLLNRRPPAGEALAEAKQMAAVFAERAPLGLAFAKRAVLRGMQMDLASAIEFEFYLVNSIYGTADKQEGVSAFLEKRKAQFSGR